MRLNTVKRLLTVTKLQGGPTGLLVVDMLSKKSFFYDSILNSGSVEIAKSISPALSRYFNFPAVAEFQLIDGPRQGNSYDCGIYVLNAIEHIIQNLFECYQVSTSQLISLTNRSSTFSLVVLVW